MTSPANPRSVPGDNGKEFDVNDEQLAAFVERVERLEEDKKQTGEDIKDVYAEAKGFGYDSKIIRKVVARRRADKDKLAEEEALIELYERAIERSGR